MCCTLIVLATNTSRTACIYTMFNSLVSCREWSWPRSEILSDIIIGTRGFSKDQLKGKHLLPTFQPDPLVVFRAKVKLGANIFCENFVRIFFERNFIFTTSFTLALKTTRLSGQNVGKSCFPLSWSLENPLVPSFWSQLRIAVFTLRYIWVFC